MLVNIFTRTDTRSKVIGAAMGSGIRAAGDSYMVTPTPYYGGLPAGDVALFYAFKGACKEILADYLKADKRVVYIDRGYFGERPPGTDHYNGYHRFAIDGLHPTPSEVMISGQNPSRWKHHRIPTHRRREGRHILLVGMSPNQARKAGLKAGEWEEGAVKALRLATNRPIHYRPKPSWDDAPILPNTLDVRHSTLKECLAGCHLTVSHHSNVAIDGMIAGVPGKVEEGPARIICPVSVNIEKPFFPGQSHLLQFLYGLSYWQWNRDEMSNGKAWDFLRQQICMH